MRTHLVRLCRFKSVTAIAAAAVTLFSLKAVRLVADQAQYTVTDLGAAGCCYDWIRGSAALGINANGDVAGFTSSPTDPLIVVPFVYRNATMTVISDNYGWATSINDAGQVTGFVQLPGRPNVTAFIYQDGAFTDLGTLPGDANSPYSIGWSINNSGTVAGESKTGAWVAEPTDMWRIKRRGARAAYGINDAGDLTGQLETMSPHAHGFLMTDNSLIDIGTLDQDPESVVIPAAINASQQIVGTAWRNGNSEERAFLYENGVMHDLGTTTLPGYPNFSSAMAINNLRHVVGYSTAGVFLYRDGTMLNLNDLVERDQAGNGYVTDARAINDAGQIAGTCYFGNSAHACLLTPIGAR